MTTKSANSNNKTGNDSPGINPHNKDFGNNPDQLQKRIADLEFQLRERNKELQTLHFISRIFSDPGAELDTVLASMVEQMPNGWLYPAETQVRLQIEEKTFGLSLPLPDACQHISADIVSNNEVIGQLTVVCTHPSSAPDTDVFLGEEYELLRNIAQKTSQLIESKKRGQQNILSEAKYKQLIENIEEIVIEVDENGILNYISPAVFKVSGFSPAELIGKPFLPYIYHDDLQYVIAVIEDIKSGKHNKLECRLLKKDMSIGWIVLSANPTFINGQYSGIAGTITDVTAKKVAELELKQKDLLFKTVIDASPDVIVITDLQGNVVFSSPKAAEIFGYSDTAVFSGHSITEFLVEQDASRAVAAIERMFGGERNGAEEYEAVKADGNTFAVEVNGEFMKDEHGTITNLIFIVRDISARKETEAKLAKTEALFKKMVESINDVIYEIDPNGVITYVSPAIEKIIGYKPFYLIGKNFFNFVHPEDKPTIAEALQNLGTNEFSFLEYRYKTKNGDTRWVRSSTKPIIENGKIIGGRGSLSDIHEKKLAEDAMRESEENFRKLIESTPVGMVVLSQQGEILLVNETFSKITGYDQNVLNTAEDWWLSAYPDDIYRNELQQRWNQELAKYFQTGESFKPFETRVRCNDGSDRFLEISFVATVHHQIVTFIDITDRINAVKDFSKQIEYTDSIIKALPDMLFVINENGEIETFNSQNTEDLYIPPELFLGKKLSEVLPPALVNKFNVEFEKIKTGVQADNVYYVLPVKDQLLDFEARFNTLTGNRVIVLISNISQRKKAERALQFAKEQLEQTGRMAKIGAFEYTTIDNQLVFSQMLTEMLSLPADYKPAFDSATAFIKAGESRELMERKTQTLLNDGQPFDIEIELTSISGKSFWARVIVQAEIKDAKLLRIFGAVQDIDAQKISEEHIRLSEEKLRIIANNTYHWEFWHGADGKAIYHSPSSEKITGLSVEELIALDDWSGKLIHADDLAEYQAHHHEVQNSQTAGQHHFRIVDKKGEVKYIFHVCQPVFDDHHNYLGIRGSNVDVTAQTLSELARRESEEKYRSLIQSSDAAITMLDYDGNYLYLNEIACIPYGMKPDQMTGINVSALFPPNQTASILADTREVISTGKGKVKEVMADINGNSLWFRTSIQPVINTDGTAYAALIYSSDITSSKLVEEKIRKSELKYKTLFDFSPVGFLIIKHGVFIECNNTAEKMLQGSRADIVGKSPASISPLLQPNGRSSEEWAIELIDEAFEKGSNSFEWQHTTLKGTDFIAQVNLTVAEYDGEKAIFTTWIDVTEKRANEEQLRKLSRAVEQSPISVVITNLEGNIEYANPAACRTTGYSLEELTGKNPRVLKSGETLEDEYTQLWGNITNGREWKGIFHNRRKNGELYWESSTISPIISSRGETTHYIAIKEDITERKKIQEALLESEKRFSQIAEQSQTVIWEIDTEGLYTYVNNVSEKVWGYTPGELIGKIHFYDLHPEEGREAFKASALEALARKVTLKDFENKVVHKNGNVLWMNTNGTPIFGNDKEVTGYRGADNDITDRKNAEEELSTFRLVSDQANVGNAIASPDGTLLYSNQTFAEMHGYSVEELIGKPLSMLHNEEQMIKVRDTIQQLMDHGGFTAEEVWRTRKDGSKFPTLMNGKVILDQQGRPKLMAASSIDITDWKKTELSLRKSEENLNSAQEIADMGSWEFNLETHEVSWSKNYYKLVGHNPAFPPLSLDEIKKTVHSDDSHLFEETIKTMQPGATPDTIYFRLEHPEKGQRWIQANMVPHFRHGNLVSISGVSIDITAKKVAEEQIRQQNIKLNAILDAMPDMIFTSDKDGNYIEYFKSKANRQYNNYENLIGLNVTDAFDEETAKLHLEKISYCLNTNQIVTYEYPRIEDGLLKYFEGRIVAMENDKVLRFVRDITERKDNEREIRKLNLAIEQSPVAIVITDLEAKIEYVNPAFCITTGYSAEEAVGLNTNILRSGLTPKETYDDMWDKITKGESWSGEWVNKRKNGELYWESISITPIHNDQGLVTNYLAIKQDISDRKENEQKILELNAGLERKVIERTSELAQTNDYLLKEIEERKAIEEALQVKSDELENFFSVALDLLCIADTQGNFIKVNTAWSEILGYSTAELENRPFLEFVHPDDIQSTLDAMMQLSEQNPILEFVNRYRTKDGSYRYIEWHSVPIGNTIYAAARDITRRKRTEDFEQELLQLSTQLTGIQLSEIDNSLNMALSRIGKFLDADRAYIIENNVVNKTMTCTYEWDGSGIAKKMDDIRNIPYNAVGHLMEIILNKQRVFTSSVEELPDSWINEKNIFRSQNIQSFVLIPMVADDEILGLVGLDSVHSKRQYSPEELNILKIWSSMLASLINDRKTESLLEQTRQNYVTFFNTIDDFLFVFDETGNIVDTNNTVTQRLGYQINELKEQNILIVRPPDRRPEAMQTIARMISGEVGVCTIPLMAKNGELIPVETRIKKGLWNGQEVVFGVSKDISQIKLSEQKFSTAFQSNAAAMAISGFYDGEYIDINNSFVEFLGFTREEMLGKTGRDMDIFVDPATRTTIIKTLETGEPVRKLEIKLRAKNGSIMIGLASCDSIYISQQRCMLAVIVDITERKKAEEALMKAREDADRANLAKSEFLSRMSHELRTPMNSILGFAQLLEMGSLDNKQKTGVNHIIKSGKHLLELINEVLDISRIESGRLSISIEPVEVYSLLNEMFDIVKPLAASKNISLNVPEDTINLFVKADRQRVKQVLINLVNNAIKYNYEGGSVAVEIQKVTEPGNMFSKIKIAITDTGPGIETEDLPKLFIPFERIGAEKTQTEGTGLGLAVVKKLMDAMGGETGVESEINKGSTFWFSLPEVIDPKSGVAGSKAVNFSQSESLNKNGTILYIEDNTSNIELVGQIIADYQSDITLHYELFGRNALEQAIEVQPDLILLDLNLPDIHGSEVLEILQADGRTKNIPVVIISADAMPHQLIKLLKAGAKNYITKPIDVHHFIRTLNQFLNK